MFVCLMHEYEKLNEHFAERSFSCVQISLYIYHHTHNVSESMFVYEFIRIKLPCIHTKAICALFFSQCLLPFAPTSKTEKKKPTTSTTKTYSLFWIYTICTCIQNLWNNNDDSVYYVCQKIRRRISSDLWHKKKSVPTWLEVGNESV